MNEQTARELLMDYLYDEISAADRKKLEAYMEENPDMRKELSELSETRSLLQQAPEVTPRNEITIVETGSESESTPSSRIKQLIPSSVWMRRALAAAACIALMLVSAAVADVHMQSTQSGFAIYFGGSPSPQVQGLSDAQTEAIVEQMKQENAAILTEYADMLNRHNQQQLQQVIAHFERQRINDLQLIDQALSNYQQQTESQITQTRQVLGEVIETMAANN